MAELTHWKKLNNPDYLGAYALQPGQEIILTIKKVGLEMVTGADGKKEECTVAHFIENVKPMILNTTNCKTISNTYKTPYIEEWEGKRIQIFATMVKAFGTTEEALRIRPIIPKDPKQEKPLLSKDHPRWDSAVKALGEGSTTIEAIQKKYTLPPEELEVLRGIQDA